MHNVYLKTYGCQMNERDTEQVQRMFLEKGGYAMTKDESDADVILINTCSVRDQAEQKALGKMGMMGKYRENKPHAVFGYLGCMAQRLGAELFDKTPHLDLVAGTQKYHRVVEHVDGLLKARLEKQMDDPRYTSGHIVDTDTESDSQNTIRDHELKPGQSTAFVSIMQGCNMHCTFCIVPTTRGPERGRPIAEIVDECRRLADKGVREVTLLGQIVNLYGRHEFPKIDNKSPFVQLLEAIHAIDDIHRIRFTSPHPIGYKDDLINAFAELPKLASHVHFPLQSGSDKILKAMHRPYKAEKFVEICDKMKAARPGISITTDIIVGFPGETEEDFQMTCDIVRRVDFDNAFVFRYSKRRDTPAAEMPDDIQLSERVKEDRNQQLLKLVNSLAKPEYETLVGTTVTVLVEGPSKTNAERLVGRTSANKIVVFEGGPDSLRLHGQLLDIEISHFHNFTLYGTPALVPA
ncbi:MAG: tRNA (N6-isopentenyl adenosine(37)-C2)-methylthiotransferase MiaB [Verrucomicrobiales bacterium]|nr:tRNA (N6-isopentenyl adenosine(37)-C2)-methylthiotransferase MiaB [Verrucomicrobiales bacterium]